jgi:tyrosine-specific transport protein
MLNYLKALSIFAGTIIGVGIFGLPYVALKAGFFVVLLYFLFLSVVTLIINFIYGEVSLSVKELHRLPGYAGLYLGQRWKKFSFLVFALGIIGALLAYLIVGGEFLASLFSPYFGGTNLIYTLLFFIPGAYLVLRGIKSISQIELALLVVFLGLLVAFFFKSFSFINIEHLKAIDWTRAAFPYGVVLFSLWGLNMVPEAKEILMGNRKILRRVIIFGILFAVITYLFFIYIILGVSGPNTSKEAISGLAFSLGDNVILFGFIFGIITCFTSFITLGLALKKMFWYDFGWPKNFSWFIACSTPLFLFLVGLREYIDVIGLTGAVSIGTLGIIVVFLYREFLKKKLARRMNPCFYILPLFFVLGIAFEIFYFIIR